MSAKETGYKWSKFYWDDWANDGALQSCNLTAQGLWMHLLRVMFNSERPGYLQINNKPMTALQISKITGVDSRTIKKQLAVLIQNNVCSVDENGIIFSRRMVRESESKSNIKVTSAKRVSNDHATSTLRTSYEYATCTQEEIAENSQKQESPIIDKNRIDIEKKESNPPYIPPSGEQTKKGLRLPDDWTPDDKDQEYARNLGLDITRTALDFCDHWQNKPGQQATKINWSRAWQTWCRKAKDWGNVHHFPKQNQQQDPQKKSKYGWMIEEQKRQWGNA